MIMINLSETTKSVTIEVTGHGDDSDQSCARVSTVLDCMYLFFKASLKKYKKSNGYTFIQIYKTAKNQFELLSVLQYLATLETLYKKSIKIIKENEVK